MEKITGIGGVFFRARNPESLIQWYHQYLGIDRPPASERDLTWWQGAGPTVFTPFPEDTEYFGNPDQQFMLNFRVRNLDAMVDQLMNAGIDVSIDPATYPNGRFARLHDPEGNPIELWEPQGRDAP